VTWFPGLPVVTAADRTEWLAWRRARKLEQQRQRRQRYPRIDYTPSPAALEAIRARTFPRVGGDQSSVIDQLVLRAIGLTPE
jgi:hypothetical protein